MKRAFLYLCLAVASFACPLPVYPAAPRETIEQSYDFASGGKVRVVNVNGPVKISSWDRQQCRIVAVKELTRPDSGGEKMFEDVKVDISRKEDTIEIATRFPENDLTMNKALDFNIDWNWNKQEEGLIAYTVRWLSEFFSGFAEKASEALEEHVSVSVAYEICVPRNCDVEVKNVLGNIELTGLRGVAETNCVSGEIRVEGQDGSLKANTVNGAITVTGTSGCIQTNSVNGSVDVKLDKDHPVQELLCNAVNGSIRIELPVDLGADVELSSLAGGLSLDPALGLERKLGGKQAKGMIGSGGTKIRARVVSGSVALERK